MLCLYCEFHHLEEDIEPCLSCCKSDDFPNFKLEKTIREINSDILREKNS